MYYEVQSRSNCICLVAAKTDKRVWHIETMANICVMEAVNQEMLDRQSSSIELIWEPVDDSEDMNG